MKINLYKHLIISVLCLSACTADYSKVEKFIFLNANLEHSLDGLRNMTENSLESLKRIVVKEGNTEDGRERIKRAEELKKEGARMVGEIDKLKRKVEQEAGDGKDPKTGAVKNPFAKNRVYYFLGSSNSLGEDLQKKLDNYVNYLRTKFADFGFDKTNLPSLTEDNPLYYQKYFGNASVAEALAWLTECQVQVVEYEFKVMEYLMSTKFKRQSKNIPPIQTLVFLEKDSLQLGEVLQVNVSLVQIPPRNELEMKFQNQRIEPDNQGFGKVKFKAKGKGEQKWLGSIRYFNPEIDTTFRFEKSYYVLSK